jgi:hypothetical protein
MRRDKHLNHARNDSDANCKYNGTSWAAPSGRAGFDLPWNELLHILRLGDQAGLLHLDASGLIYHAIAHRVAQLSFRRSRRLLAFGRQLFFCLIGGSISFLFLPLSAIPSNWIKLGCTIRLRRV